MILNFDGVEAAAAKEFVTVKPGAHTLTITNVEGKETAGGTGFINVTFESSEAGASFNHPFYTTPGAMPRLQYLVKQFSGTEMTGNVTVESLAAKLVGRSQYCVVDGETRTKEKDGKVYNNTYPTLRFTAFAQPVTEKTFTDADAKVTDKTATVAATPTTAPERATVTDDLPF